MWRQTRVFNKENVHKAQAWSHYRFRQRLESSAFRRAGKYVFSIDEAYTTQTCGRCGVRNVNVGASHTFECVDTVGCGIRLDRDVNGARNIYLRFLTEQLTRQ